MSIRPNQLILYCQGWKVFATGGKKRFFTVVKTVPAKNGFLLPFRKKTLKHGKNWQKSPKRGKIPSTFAETL
jgi:hypothetical protein